MNQNLADKESVKKADSKAKSKRKQELSDIRTLLGTASGRRFIWRILEQCKTFGSVFSKDTILMARNAGSQDLGHFIMSEIVHADQNLLFKLMKENQTGDN